MYLRHVLRGIRYETLVLAGVAVTTAALIVAA